MIVLTRVFQGTLRKGQKIRLWSNNRIFDVEALGVLTPKSVDVDASTEHGCRNHCVDGHGSSAEAILELIQQRRQTH